MRSDPSVACFSNQPLAALPPAFVELLRKIKRHYPTRSFPLFLAPFSEEPSQDEAYPDLIIHSYLLRNRASAVRRALQCLDAHRVDVLLVTDPVYLEAVPLAQHRPAFVIYWPIAEDPAQEQALPPALRERVDCLLLPPNAPAKPYFPKAVRLDVDLTSPVAFIDRVLALLPAGPPAPLPSKPKLLFAESSLRNEVGHYWKYTGNVLTGARDLGLETVAAVNRMLTLPLPMADLVLPLFWVDLWGRDTTLPHLPPAPQAPELYHVHLKIALLAAKLGAGDHVFIPPLSERMFLGLPAALEEIGARFPVTWHIMMWYPPPADPRPRIEAIRKLHGLFPNAVHFYGDTVEFCRRHEELSQVPFTLLPMPVEPMAPVGALPLPSSHSNLRIAYLGDARDEKGFHHLPGVISALADLMRAGRIHFAIQKHVVWPSPAVDLAMRQLRELQLRLPISLVDGELSAAEYTRFLSGSQILLCPYDPQCYAERSSMIFFESLCAGKEVIVPRGCSSAKLLPPDCPWICDDFTQASVAATLRWMCENRAASRQWVEKLAPAFRAEHNGRRFAEILLRTH